MQISQVETGATARDAKISPGSHSYCNGVFTRKEKPIPLLNKKRTSSGSVFSNRL
jgi:hypothetical protein